MSGWLDLVAAIAIGAQVALAVWYAAEAVLGRARETGGVREIRPPPLLPFVIGIVLGATSMVGVGALHQRSETAARPEGVPPPNEWTFSGSERAPQFDSARGWRPAR